MRKSIVLPPGTKHIPLPAGTQRLTISAVLKIVDQAFAGGAIRVYGRREDGSLPTRALRGSGPVGALVKQQFLEFCKNAQVVPTSPFDRWSNAYTGTEPDDIYEITVDEFRRFVTPFGLTVGAAGEHAGGTVPPSLEPLNEFGRCLTTDEICDSFDGIGMDRQAWKQKLTKDQPRWLMAARVAVGKQGNKPVQARWNPLRIAEALVTGESKKAGVVSVDMVDRAFKLRSELRPLAAEWAHLREDHPLWK